ncbi:hypothetical protein ACFYRC_11155 [Streptomyces sp. NPDC005279]|uniref:hypothetical protein n=1 Tax=Streptomyces sp. NPDC005279 TaxID=3364712 RepID=UPI003684AB9C
MTAPAIPSGQAATTRAPETVTADPRTGPVGRDRHTPVGAFLVRDDVGVRDHFGVPRTTRRRTASR